MIEINHLFFIADLIYIALVCFFLNKTLYDSIQSERNLKSLGFLFDLGISIFGFIMFFWIFFNIVWNPVTTEEYAVYLIRLWMLRS